MWVMSKSIKVHVVMLNDELNYTRKYAKWWVKLHKKVC